jgi:hypothetical protein
MVETFGGNSGRIQFGHTCSLLIFVDALPQNAHCFLVIIFRGSDWGSNGDHVPRVIENRWLFRMILEPATRLERVTC